MSSLLKIFTCVVFALRVLMAQTPSDPDNKQEILAVIAGHSDQEAVKILKKDIESGKVSAVSDKKLPIFTPDTWQISLIRFIWQWNTEHVVSLPDKFFELDPCRQKIILEATALIHGHLSSLPENQSKLLIWFTGPDKDRDVDEQEQKILVKIIDGFEKLASDNMDGFSKMLFKECTQADIEKVFTMPVTDQKGWAETALKNIGDQFQTLREIVVEK